MKEILLLYILIWVICYHELTVEEKQNQNGDYDRQRDDQGVVYADCYYQRENETEKSTGHLTQRYDQIFVECYQTIRKFIEENG